MRGRCAPQARRNKVNHFEKTTGHEPAAPISISPKSFFAPVSRFAPANWSSPHSISFGWTGMIRSLAVVFKRLSVVPLSERALKTIQSTPSMVRISVASSWQIRKPSTSEQRDQRHPKPCIARALRADPVVSALAINAAAI